MQRAALTRPGTRPGAIIGSLLLTLGSSAAAYAYCLNQTYINDVAAEFPDQRIPVYVSTGMLSTVANTGVSPPDVARVLLEVIARHNETVVSPKLYFAGFDSTDFKPPMMGMTTTMLNAMEQWPKGIMVYGFPCDLLLDEKTVNHAFLCNATSKSGFACGFRHWNGVKMFAGGVVLLPPNCNLAVANDVVWSLDGSTPNDLGQTLLHEIGHVLGLKHNNMSAAECVNDNGVPGNHPDGNHSVMRTTKGASLSDLRHWRRDDLDGLAAAYPNHPIHEFTHWRDLAFPAAPAIEGAQSVAGTEVIRSGALADVPPNHAQPLVTVGPDRRVLFASLASDGSVVEPPSVIDQGAHGVTVGSPDVAVGDDGFGERAFVVWTAGEQSTTAMMQLRWGLRELDGGAWELFEGIATTTSRVGAGFDPASSAWLIASLSSAGEPSISVIDPSGAPLLTAEAIAMLPAWEIGNPICTSGTPNCTLLLSTTEFGGPTLARLDFSVQIDPPALLLDSTTVFDGQDVSGRIELARADPGFLRSIGGRFYFELGTDPAATPLPAMPSSTHLTDWPVALGAFSSDHRLGLPTIVECGNGLMQGAEACDDGNLVGGDGCSAQCEIEPDDPGTGTGTETGFEGGTGFEGETGDAGLILDDDGCNCSTGSDDPPARLAWGWLVVGGLAAARPRRP